MFKNKAACRLVYILILSAFNAYADPTPTPTPENKTAPATKEDVDNVIKKIDKLESQFDSIGWDIGIGAESYKSNYIADASIGADKKVRVTEEYNVQPSVWLQFSWLNDYWNPFERDNECTSLCWGGIYSGVKLAGQNSTSLDSFSVGFVLLSFKPGASDKSQHAKFERFYIGIGPVIHKTRTFINGINDGSELPTGLTEIEYKKSYERSIMLMLGVRL